MGDWTCGSSASSAGLLRPPPDRITVLDRPGRLDAEVLRGLDRPVRLAEQLAGEEDQVGVAAGDDLVGLRRLGDQADRAGQDPGLVADPPRERDLVALGRPGCAALGTRAPDETSIRSTPSSLSRQARARPTARRPSRPRPSRSPRSARTAAARRASAPRSRSATRRSSRIRFSRLPPYSSLRWLLQRREELVQQVAVRRVDLDHAEPGAERAAAAASKAATMPSIPASSSGTGTGSPSLNGIGLGPTTVQPPSSGVFRRRLPSTAGRNWPCGRRGRAGCPRRPPGCGRTGRSGPGARRASSPQMPRSPGVIRPSRVTAVASTMTSAAPPTARLPRWTRCQSSAKPSRRAVLAHRRHHDAVPEGHAADRQRAEQVDLRQFAVVFGVRRATMGGRAGLGLGFWHGR